MRLRKITLEGFQSYREREEVDLQGLNLTAIYGKNHTGKSTLISNALDFALYGRSRSDLINDVISRGAPRVFVSVEFDLGDNTYRISRARTAKGNPEVILEVSDPREESGWRAITEKNPLTADPVILDLLGMNAQTAAMTWMIHQNDYGAFCDLLPSKRRDVLADAFGLSKFAELAKSAEVAKRTTDSQLDRARYDLTNTQARIDTLTNDGPFPEIGDDEIATRATEAEEGGDKLTNELAALGDNAEVKQRHQQAQESLNYFNDAYQRELRQYRGQRSQMEQYLLAATRQAATTREAVNAATVARWSLEDGEEDLVAADATATAAHARIADAEAVLAGAEAALDEVQAKAPDLSSRIGAAQATAATAKDQASQIVTVVESLHASMADGAGVCIACQRPMSDEEAHEQIADQETKREALRLTHNEAIAEAERLGADLHALNSQIVDARNQVQSARQALASAEREAGQAQRDADAMRETLSATRALAAELPTRKSAATEAAAALEKAQSAAEAFGDEPVRDEDRFEALRAALEKAAADLKATEGGEQRRQQITQERAELRERARRLWQEQQRRGQVATDLAALAEPLKKAQAQADELEEKSETYAVLVDAFKPSGIPFMILSGVIEELNEEANEIIAELGDDGLSVLVTTASENQRGGTAEKVMVYAVTSDGQANYSALSGSEQTRVALSIRLGLAQCIARRTGTPIETIVMDECWGMFDDAGKRAVMNVLIQLSERFAVFSVSHLSDVTESFPDSIEVDMSTGTSRATVRPSN